MTDRAKILLYGFGNPGRQDDGLGITLVDMLENEQMPGMEYDRNYQLNIEDAHRISEYDTVIFIDASMSLIRPFEFNRITPGHDISFTTHSMTVESIAALCEELYGKTPAVYTLAVRGFEWEANHEISAEALCNLDEAYTFLKELLKRPAPETFSAAAS